MRWYRGFVHCCLLGTVFICSGAEGISEMREDLAESQPADNPYQAIASRNVFALRPVPPPPSPEPQKSKPPEIILSGITSLQGRLTAFLKVPPVAAKRGQAPTAEQYFSLSEGEMERELKVVEIDPDAGEVKIVFEGSELELNFDENGAKPYTAPAATVAGRGPNRTYPAPVVGRRITLPTRVQRTTSGTRSAIPPPPTRVYQRPGS